MNSIKLAIREWFNHKFLLCILIFSMCLSLSAFLTLDIFQQGVNTYVETEKKIIAGSDLTLESRQPFSEEVVNTLATLPPESVSKQYSFSSVVFTNEESELANVNIVSNTYPLYGTVELQSGRPFAEVLTPGNVVVESTILQNLNISVGDTLSLGNAELIVSDVILSEPNQPISGFGFGARILANTADLENIDLVGDKSRVRHTYSIKTDSSEQTAEIQQLLSKFVNEFTTLQTADEQNQNFVNIVNNFIFFLKLVVLIVVLLSGIVITTIVQSFFERNIQSISIRMSLGQTTGCIVRGYAVVLIFWALIGIGLSFVLASIFVSTLPQLFQEFIPQTLTFSFPPLSFLKTTLWGFSTMIFFAVFEFEKLKNIQPLWIIRQPEKTVFHTSKIVVTTVIFAIFVYSFLLWIEFGDILLSIGFTLAFFVFGVLIWLSSFGFLKILSKTTRNKSWFFTLALNNITRKVHQSAFFIGIVSLTIALVTTLITLESNIQKQFISSYPEDAPNIFILDIRKEDTTGIQEIVTGEVSYFPVIRARISQINNQNLTERQKRENQFGDDVNRTFNLTYGQDLIPNEKLIDAITPNQLYAEVPEGTVPMSILDSAADLLGVKMNDTVTFLIQGIEIQAYITSIRERTSTSPSPFFYYVFPEEVLADAPQIRFAVSKIDPVQIPEVQTQIAKRYPYISTIDVSKIAQTVGEVLGQLSSVTQFFMLYSIVVSFLILLSSILSTTSQRIKEVSYFFLLGMKRHSLYALYVCEFCILSASIIFFGIGGGILISYLLLENLMSVSFIFPTIWIIGGLALSVLASIIGIGLLTMRNILNKKAIYYVRKLYG